MSESPSVEVKNWLNGLGSTDEKARLAKEIIALANSGGGDIFLGFVDGDGHPEIRPGPGEAEAFTQDAIASLVEKYVSPPCQCTVNRCRCDESEIDHPVITVPGNDRTPVFAKRGSPDDGILKSGTVYVRRPGGASEPARTQDDWDQLLDRLVRARRTKLPNAIRDVLNPPPPRKGHCPRCEP